MKTIKDAYEDLKGDIKNSFFYKGEPRLYWSTKRKRYIGLHRDNEIPRIHQYICTVEEFNNYNPAYTQEMHEAGELPPIGSLFIDVEFNENKVVEAIAHDAKLALVVYKAGDTVKDVEYYGAALSECKPLEPPVKLVDGKAYQFNNRRNEEYCGIYNEDRKILNVDQGQWFDVVAVTNIQPLTVEK